MIACDLDRGSGGLRIIHEVHVAVGDEELRVGALVLDRWSLSILAVLYDGPLRFNELRREIPGITQKSLAQTLKRLERNGILDRAVLDSRPLGVEYGITTLGRSLEEPVKVLAEWAAANNEEVQRARARYDA